MRTMWVFITAGLMALMGCAGETRSTKTKVADADSMVAVKKGKDMEEVDPLVGVYKGTMPSAECEGVQVTLTLMEGEKYNMVYQSGGGKSMIVEINGVYDRTPDLGLLVLETPKSKEKIFFKVLNAHEVMLADSTGKVDCGPLAKKYVLLKCKK